MHSLRTRLILSHILPLLVIVPLIGIALIYILETQVLLADLSNELTEQAATTAAWAANQPQIWNDSSEAQVFVTRFTLYRQSEIQLLDYQGRLVASSNPSDTDQVGKPLEVPDLPTALDGERAVHSNYSMNLKVDVVEVLVPVAGPDQQIVGVVRLTHQLSSVFERFARLRNLIAGVLLIELALGIVMGLILALNLERPLRHVTQAISGIANGGQWDTLPENGPDEIRQLLHAFNSLIERLRTLEDDRRRLLANIVHEVSRPIGALQTATEALLKGADEDPTLRRQLLEGMQSQARSLRPLLDNLAQLHGMVLGTMELQRRPTPLTDWLRRTVSPWRESAHAKGLHWQVDIPDSLPEIDMDGDRLSQVLGNLLSNAIKYTHEGTVYIQAATEDEGVAIMVGDTGLGMTTSEQARVFEPFYRSQRNQRFPQGMGLGLSIARDLVTAHGGHLEVHSQPNQGSQFLIWLPLDKTPPDTQARTPTGR